MNITKIELHNFRNYSNYKIDKFTNLNIIIGNNGVGKTSILESIYLGSLAKTFKSNDDYTMIKYGECALKIKIFFYHNFVRKNIEVLINDTGKKTKINDATQRKLSDFISQYRVMLFSPDELKIIKSTPNTRRSYFNIQISQLYKNYIIILNDYNKLIKNKNEFLKKLMLNSNLDTKYLDIVDEKIIDLGLLIYTYRREYIEKINIDINEYFNKFNQKDLIKIEYVSDFDVNDKQKLIDVFKKNRRKEINLGMASFGIHRDDYDFMYNAMNSRDYSSQGTQKLIILAMKLAEINVFKKYYDIEPIVLLDDLFSELDEKNRNKIFDALDNSLQIFITTTDVKNINKKIINKAKVFNLDERKIKYEK